MLATLYNRTLHINHQRHATIAIATSQLIYDINHYSRHFIDLCIENTIYCSCLVLG